MTKKIVKKTKTVISRNMQEKLKIVNITIIDDEDDMDECDQHIDGVNDEEVGGCSSDDKDKDDDGSEDIVDESEDMNNSVELSIEKIKPKKKRVRVKCEHGKRPHLCVLCGGVSTCQHKRVRAQCIDCGGKNVCPHKRLRADCRECSPASFCCHNQYKSRCKECKGNLICPHERIKGVCKDCNPGGGGQMCIHNIIRKGCIICNPKILCIHNKRKQNCDLCEGYSRCIHKKFKTLCDICDGSQLCIHKKNKRRCLDCSGEDICSHGKYKLLCNTCDIIVRPDKWCKACMVVRVVKSPYKPYCYLCYFMLNPDKKCIKKYKLKEHYMVEELKEKYQDIDLIFDKQVDNGCSSRRPDVRIECYTHSVIIECDENQHTGYSCENKRIMEIFQDLGERPIVFLRFNPDSYIDSNGTKIESCFISTQRANNEPVKKEWKRRIDILISRIDYYLKNIPEKEVTVEHLFYSKKD